MTSANARQVAVVPEAVDSAFLDPALVPKRAAADTGGGGGRPFSFLSVFKWEHRKVAAPGRRPAISLQKGRAGLGPHQWVRLKRNRRGAGLGRAARRLLGRVRARRAGAAALSPPHADGGPARHRVRPQVVLRLRAYVPSWEPGPKSVAARVEEHARSRSAGRRAAWALGRRGAGALTLRRHKAADGEDRARACSAWHAIDM